MGEVGDSERIADIGVVFLPGFYALAASNVSGAESLGVFIGFSCDTPGEETAEKCLVCAHALENCVRA